jgi:hypothetical protein
VRLIAGWTGIGLFYLSGILAALVAAWFFARMARGDVRLAQRITQHPAQLWGLAALDGAVAAFGMGLAVTSLDSAPLVPLGLGFVGLSIAMGTFGIRLFRRRP